MADDESVASNALSTVHGNRAFNLSTHPLDGDIDLSTSAGIKAFNSAIQIDGSFTKLELSVTNANAILAKIKSKVADCRMFKFFKIPTNGTGVPEVTEDGVLVALNGFTEYKDLLTNHNSVEFEEVQAFACYNWGGNLAEREVTLPLELRAINPEEIPDGVDEITELDRLKRKQQYRIRSEMLTGIIKAVLTDDDYKLFVDTEEADIIFVSDDGDRKVDGFALFKKAMEETQPEVVIETIDKERQLESMTVAQAGNNIQVLTRTMESLYKDIKKANPGHYDVDRYMSHLFRALLTAKNDDFNSSIRQIRNKWMIKKSSIKPSDLIKEANVLFKNIDTLKEWNALSESDKKILALTSKVETLQTKLNETKKAAGAAKAGDQKKDETKSDADKRNAEWEKQKAWRTKKAGKTLKKDGKDWVWCEHHNEGKGMYMPEGHVHSEWKKEREQKNADKKARRSKRQKDGATAPSTSSSTATGKLTLAKHLVEALTTQVGVSEADAKKLADDILKQSKA